MRVLSLVLILLWLTGCSVFMAADGGEEYNYSLLKEGTPREAILASFGDPKSSEAREDGRIVDTYVLEEGNKSRPGIAAAHLVMDLATLGLWEIAGTIMEANEGRDITYEITYNPDGKIASIHPPVYGSVPRPQNFGIDAHSIPPNPSLK